MTEEVSPIIGVLIFLTIAIIWILAYRYYEQNTLYNRLGGIFNIAAVVDKFSDDIIKNPKVGKNSPNPYLRDWSNNKLIRLPGLKFMRTLWLAAISGGPFEFTPTMAGKCPFSLENAHRRFHISGDEFDEVASILAHTLDEFKVPERERNEVMNVFMAHKMEVVSGMPPTNC